MPQGRLLLVQRVTDQGWTVGSAAGAAGLSERQTYRWLARYRAGGAAALIDRSSAPQRCRHAVPGARVAEIEHWRRQRLSGPVIARHLGMPVSTVGGILRRLGLGKLAALEPGPPVVRYERERPGELIHIDTKKLGRCMPGMCRPRLPRRRPTATTGLCSTGKTARCVTPRSGARRRPWQRGSTRKRPAFDTDEHVMAANEVFWVIKNGIRFTGMPAWGPSLTDKEIWDVTAFLAALPTMPAADYDAIDARIPETVATP